MTTHGGQETFEVTLRDGSRAAIRRIRPDDKDLLQAGMAQLSERSRYLRFHAPIDHLSAAQLAYLTEVDHHDHVAWVALDPGGGVSQGMGVARYVRLRDEPEVAEAAVTVVDRYQGRGLGTVLLAILEGEAVANGVRQFRNYVLSENREMLRLFEALGGERHHEGHGVDRIDLPLPEDPSQLPDTPTGRVFRQIARQHWPAPALDFPPLWTGPPGPDDPTPAPAERSGPPQPGDEDGPNGTRSSVS